jgi:hypothetical protein
MDRIDAAVGRLDAEVVAQEIGGDVIAQRARTAAVDEARFDLAVAAAVDRDIAALREYAALGRDIDDAGGAQSELGRQCARDQAER